MNPTSELSVGARIKSLRKNKKITQKKLGELIGLSQKAISNIEKGETALTLEHQINLCKVFNVSHDYLITGIDRNSLHKELCSNVSISYKSIIVGDNLYEIPQISINKTLFNYLMTCARINKEKYIPKNIKENWLDQEIEKFYNSKSANAKPVELIPLPQEMIYPDSNKSEWKQSDLIRELNAGLSKYQEITK